LPESALASPIRVGSIEVKNRIALAPVSLGYYTPDGSIPRETIHFVEARARGEVGLIISQFARVSKYQKFPSLGAHEDRFIPGLTDYVKVCHRYGAKVFLQLAAMGGADPFGSYAPSAVNIPWYEVLPKELAKDQIVETIEEFVQAAVRAKKAEMDGVEFHGAYGYLMAEFMSPFSNRRTDEYGGDFERRMRVPVEIVRGIRRTCGNDFPIGLKFNAYEDFPGGIDPELGVKIAKLMTDEGVVYIHPVAMASNLSAMGLTKYPNMPILYQPQDIAMGLTGYVKSRVGEVPVIAAGGIKDSAMAENLITSGKADILALGRALMADADWASRAMKGSRIRQCIRCNVCHFEAVSKTNRVLCTVNPYLMREAEEPLKRAERPKKVMVVGGGPAGIMAATVASRRGHKVTLYEKKSELGGLLIAGCRPPFKTDILGLLDYLRGEINESDVELRLGEEITPEEVREHAPDALIIAVGASPIVPPIEGLDKGKTLSATDAFLAPARIGRKPLVIGGGVTGCEAALYLAQEGREVMIVEKLSELMPLEEIGYKYTTGVLAHMVKEAGVKAMVKSEVIEVAPSSATIKRGSALVEVEADTIVLSIGLKPNQQNVDSLRGSCKQSYVVGDCQSPGRILEAVREGDKAGRAV